MKKITDWVALCGPALLMAVGAAAVSAGVGMIYFPAGLIAAGVLTLASGVLLILGGGGDSV